MAGRVLSASEQGRERSGGIRRGRPLRILSEIRGGSLMRFFDNATLQSFARAPDGSRLFYSFGPWSRRYVVPDDATERRLATRQGGMGGVLVGLIGGCQALVRRGWGGG